MKCSVWPTDCVITCNGLYLLLPKHVREMSLRGVVEEAGLSLSACASTLGVDYGIFQQWADSQREMPPAYASILAAVLGVSAEVLTAKPHFGSRSGSKAEPAAIWFKFRGNEFTDADRESILLIRRLGHNANLLEQAVQGQANRSWSLLFQNIRESVNAQASPQEQGRVAARSFRSLTQFGSGGRGSGDVLRGALRAKGILVIESPIPGSKMEGCSFLVGDNQSERPCIFVNTFRSTWFRRNTVIMHELGHALFDQNSGVEIDTVSDPNDDSKLSRTSITEVRAEVFARECLLPKNLVLSFFSQEGIHANRLLPESLAALVAFSGVEKKTVIEILQDYQLIDEVLASQYLAFEIAEELRKISDHALSTKEFISKIGLDVASSWINKRLTTLTSRGLLLPVTYVKSVIDAVRGFKISLGRACELLMIDRETFEIRFPDVTREVAE